MDNTKNSLGLLLGVPKASDNEHDPNPFILVKQMLPEGIVPWS